MINGFTDISRRTFIKYGITTAALVSSGCGITTNDTFRTTQFKAATHGRVRPTRVDAHGHTVLGLTADRVISLLDKAGINHMVLMANMALMDKIVPMGGRQNDSLTSEIFKQSPQRILPFVSSIHPSWIRQDERVFSYAENQLSTGIFKGVGEVLLQ